MDEEEYQAAVATLQSLATTIDADMVLLRQRKVEKGITGQYLIRKRVDTSDFMEIRYINFLNKYAFFRYGNTIVLFLTFLLELLLWEM